MNSVGTNLPLSSGDVPGSSGNQMYGGSQDPSQMLNNPSFSTNVDNATTNPMMQQQQYQYQFELEKVKKEKAELETKLQLLKSSDVSILTTAKNQMEKKYHEIDLELAKTKADMEKLKTSKSQLEEKEKKEVSQNQMKSQIRNQTFHEINCTIFQFLELCEP